MKWNLADFFLVEYCYCCSVAKLFPTLCNPMDCSRPGFPVLHYLPEFAKVHVHWVSDIIQPFHPLSTLSPPAHNLSQHQGLFQWVALCIMWPKNWSFTFSTTPSNEHPGLISFRIDWFDLAVQGTLKSLLSTTVQKHQFFSGLNSAVGLLYGPTLTSIHDYWKDQSFG